MRLEPPQPKPGRVCLRPPHPRDAAPYAQAFLDDPDLGRLIGFEDDPDETAALARLLAPTDPESDEHLALTISEAHGEGFLGSLLLHSLSRRHRRGELGFWVVPGARRHGLATEAVGLALDWLFWELELLRVEMTTTPDNAAVALLAERIGFTREGVLRSRNIERGERVDLVWFGLLREEWRSPPA